VNIARSATFLSLSLYAAFSPLNVVAAPSSAGGRPSSKASTSGTAGLTFKVTARVGGTGQFAGPQQTVQARVLLRGNATRVETVMGGTPSVVLFTPPYVYRLLPASKAGVRWKLDDRKIPTNLADLDPQMFMRDPSRIKHTVMRVGAKRLGNSVLNGIPVEIYEAKNFGRVGQRLKVWLRRSDSLPVRVEETGGQIQVVASWRDYAKPKNLPASLFQVPKGFNIRKVAGRPPFSAI
jgi:hypothetical protein